MAVVGTDTTVADPPPMYCEGGPESICPLLGPEAPLPASVCPLTEPGPYAASPLPLVRGAGAGAAPLPELATPNDAALSVPPLPCDDAGASAAFAALLCPTPPLALAPPLLAVPDAATAPGA